MKKILVAGKVKGIILKSEKPINFLGTVDKKTGVISDKNHDLFKKSIKDTLLERVIYEYLKNKFERGSERQNEEFDRYH